MLSGASALALDITALMPGASREDIARRMEAAGIRGDLGGHDVVFDARLLDEIFEVQRARLRFGSGGSLSELDLQITPGPGADALEVLDLYEETLEALLDRFGPPAWERREGAVRDPRQALIDLATGELVVEAQWEGEHTVRLGIPSRADGEILVEVLITSRRLSRSVHTWGGDRF
jgi:hypothetical protein